MSMNIHAKKGDKVKYNGINGADSDKMFAIRCGLIEGKEYTIDRLSVFAFYTHVVLEEFGNLVFNGVMFDDVEQTLDRQVDEYKDGEYSFILNTPISQADEFNAELPFEVNDEGEWVQDKRYHFVGFNVKGNPVIQIDGGGYYSYNGIRNVKKPELKYGDTAWGKPEKNNPSGIWLFGTFDETKDGSLVINHQNEQPIECTVIRPFFVDGIATYPPFND